MNTQSEMIRVPFVRDEDTFPLVSCDGEARTASDLIELQRVMQSAGVEAADVYHVLCALTPYGRVELDLTSSQRTSLVSNLNHLA